MCKLFLSITFCFTITFAITGSQPTKVITNIKNWQHPVKKVFEQSHIDIFKVELYNKTYPVFYTNLPNIALVRDKIQFEQIIAKVAKENAYWDFSIKKENRKSNLIEIKIVCDKISKSVKEIQYVSGKDFFEDSSYCYSRMVETSIGTLTISDISTDSDTNQYLLSFGNASAKLLDNDFAIEKIINVQVNSPNKGYLLVQYNGPGLNCHEQYRIIELQHKTIKFSEQFGACFDFSGATLTNDSLILEMENTLSNSKTSRIIWAGGYILSR